MIIELKALGKKERRNSKYVTKLVIITIKGIMMTCFWQEILRTRVDYPRYDVI